MRSSFTVLRCVFFLSTLFLAGAGSVGRTVVAQDVKGAADYVKWTVTSDPVAPGKTAILNVSATIAEGWKMYAMDSPKPSRAVTLELKQLPDGITPAGAPTQKTPKEGFDPNFGVNVRYFEHDASFKVPVAVGQGVSAGSYDVGLLAIFMICNDRMCLPPTKVPFTAGVTVTAAAASETAQKATEPVSPNEQDPVKIAPPAPDTQQVAVSGEQTPADSGSVLAQLGSGSDPAAPSETVGDLDRARSGGLFGFILLAIGAGLAALLTPCVFPMIPLTVSFFAKQGGSRQDTARMATVYGLAIIATFTGLGILMALLTGAAGAQTIAANPWINLFIGLVFVVFALSLLGLFELRLPSGLLNYFNRQSNDRKGYTGVLFMGLTLTLVSFSCTAPFVGGLLAATASGEWAYPVLGMVAFSTTFALPFILFALFPNALSALPKSGSWMNVIKVVLGFVELAAAIKFLSNADLIWGWSVISRPLAIAVTVVLFFLAGLYLIGKLKLAGEPAPEEIGVARLLTAVFFFGVSLYMLPGLLGAPLNALDAYLPPRQATDVSMVRLASSEAVESHQAEGDWFVDDFDGALARASAEGRPLFVDFTGYTCTNCRQMEANVFTDAGVAGRFKSDFVLARLYTDGLEKGEDFQRLQLKLTGTVALPTYAIIDPATRNVLIRHTGMASVAEFVAFLEDGAGDYTRSLAVR